MAKPSWAEEVLSAAHAKGEKLGIPMFHKVVEAELREAIYSAADRYKARVAAWLVLQKYGDIAKERLDAEAERWKK